MPLVNLAELGPRIIDRMRRTLKDESVDANTRKTKASEAFAKTAEKMKGRYYPDESGRDITKTPFIYIKNANFSINYSDT